ncbi:subclass B1 metallo-beta-lactamase [Mucilaginibacter psychrotolerans]|nr:subclass B1 metallo-beta-lactamase [Mucilaginibacter psychrotolerans]
MKFKLLVLLLMLSPRLFAQKTEPQIIITPLTKNYYVVTSHGYPDKDSEPYPANSLFVVTDAGIVLIDTPWGEAQTQQLIDTVEKTYHKKIVLCIATHFHDDKVIGFDILKKAGTKTYSSTLTYQLAKKEHNKLPEFTFGHDTTFTIGSLTLKTYFPGEGHTKDNIVVWFPNDLVLVGGCLVKSLDTDSEGFIGDANLKNWSTAIENVIKYYGHAKYIIPGHLGWQGGVEQLSHTMDVVK